MRWFSKKEPKPRGRFGIVEVNVEGWGRYAGVDLDIQVTVEELDTAGNLSMIKPIRIGTDDDRIYRKIKGFLNKQWIDSNEITWLDK